MFNNLHFAFSIKTANLCALGFRFRKYFFDKITGFLGLCIRLRASRLRRDKGWQILDDVLWIVGGANFEGS